MDCCFRATYKIGDTASAGIIYDNGTTAYSMQVFQCTCSTNNVSPGQKSFVIHSKKCILSTSRLISPKYQGDRTI